ncbi:MAG TPA: hypothetical protein VGC14_02100 [Rhizobium sp.]
MSRAPAKKHAETAMEKPFPLPVNGARGEAPLWIDDVPLVLAATMQGLANVSSRLECKSINDLFTRMSGAEAAATWVGIELLTVRGDRHDALDKLRLKHFTTCAAAFSAILAHHFDGDEGNAEAAGEAA